MPRDFNAFGRTFPSAQSAIFPEFRGNFQRRERVFPAFRSKNRGKSRGVPFASGCLAAPNIRLVPAVYAEV